MDKVIDGVDVSECEYANACDKKLKCIILQDDVCETKPYCEGYNCYYKQLKQLQAENVELKKTVLQKCPNCNEEYLSPIGSKLYEENTELKAENEELQAQLNNITVQSNNVITALEQENERLKGSLKISQGLCKTLEKAKSNEHEQWFIRCCEINTELDKYRQCLQEIKRIIIQEKVTNNKKLRAILDLITEAE